MHEGIERGGPERLTALGRSEVGTEDLAPRNAPPEHVGGSQWESKNIKMCFQLVERPERERRGSPRPGVFEFGGPQGELFCTNLWVPKSKQIYMRLTRRVKRQFIARAVFQ